MRFQKTHPWIDFTLDLKSADYRFWITLGEIQSTCEHIAGVPLSPSVAKQVHQLYLAKGAWATTAIEGNTLSEEDARDRVAGKLQLPPSKAYLGQEIDNILIACNLIASRLENEYFPTITTESILEFNKLVLEKLESSPEVVPGMLRKHSVGVGNYLGAPAEDCQFLMDQLCEWLNGPAFRPDQNSIAFGVMRAIIAHLYTAWIHPFGDGNGRTARLVEVQILLSAGVPSPASHLLSNHYNATRNMYYLRLDASSRSASGVLDFVRYALEGFLDGLREQQQVIRTYQWEVGWRQSIYDAFVELTSETDKRRRDLVLEISAKDEGKLIPLNKLRELSGKTAQLYAGKSQQTLMRDVELLSSMSLVLLTKDGVRSRREHILQFLPLRREQ